MPYQSVNRSVPSFFSGCVAQARAGGAFSYAGAGWHLANSADSVADEPEQVDQLRALLESNDRDGVWSWFAECLPGCAALVPARRRQNFVDGVFACFEERGV